MKWVITLLQFDLTIMVGARDMLVYRQRHWSFEIRRLAQGNKTR